MCQKNDVKKTVYDKLIKKANAILTNDISNILRKADYEQTIMKNT